ncbi:MAG: HU family DNA-binding protein [Gammaproteobacteria bacterium]|nr:HU family DNA-binding protein [Gammaproteobacteria bacterium]
MKRLYDKALMEQIAKVYGNEMTFLSEFSKALLDIIREGLIRDGQVRLHQFGTFKLKWMESRSGVNPSSGNKILIQGRPRVIFTPAKRLKEVVEPNPLPRVPWSETDRDSVNQAKISVPAVSLTAQTDKVNTVLSAIPVVAAVKVAQAAEEQADSPVNDELIAELSTDTDDQLLSESDKILLAENNEADDQTDKTETVIADINDEIKVLEQVAEILKNESVTNNAEKVTVGHADYLEDAAVKRTDSFQAFKDRNQKNSLAPALEEKDLAWNDQSVVDHIKKLSERHAFNSPEKSEKASPKFATPEIIVRTDTRSALYETSDAKTDQDLDKELNSVSKLNADPLETDERQNYRKPWFALAAVAIVLLAIGSLMNIFTAPTDHQAAGTQAVTESALETSDTQTQQAALAVEEQEGVIPEQESVLTQTDEVLQTNTDSAEKVIDTELAGFTTDQPAVVETEELTESGQFVAENDALTDQTTELNLESANQLKQIETIESTFFTARDYRLINGDSLWRLAKKYYVNPFYWPHIYQANHNSINNPDRVKIGKLVLLPTMYGEPDALTKQDKHNIATGYYYNYLYHKERGNPYAYFSLIGVEKFDADLLIEYKDEIARSDIKNLSLLSE